MNRWGDPYSWSTPPDIILPCGCYKLKGAAWFGCDEHERPGGHESQAAYEAAWAHVECVVCHRRGFLGGQDFESIWKGDGMMYAHGSCRTLANIFPDMRPKMFRGEAPR